MPLSPKLLNGPMRFSAGITKVVWVGASLIPLGLAVALVAVFFLPVVQLESPKQWVEEYVGEVDMRGGGSGSGGATVIDSSTLGRGNYTLVFNSTRPLILRVYARPLASIENIDSTECPLPIWEDETGTFLGWNETQGFNVLYETEAVVSASTAFHLDEAHLVCIAFVDLQEGSQVSYQYALSGRDAWRVGYIGGLMILNYKLWGFLAGIVILIAGLVVLSIGLLLRASR